MVRIVSWLLLWCQREVCKKFATPQAMPEHGPCGVGLV
ncbi:hypothetical protein APS_0789 [Acetobacter pasteurianus subsp. pasteurianus LMG 1262 = NBRC 106471]|nr:hypothetical protein APS_0789 [Acetobacter pasteurianus subsp. pasteurianus LMG 1262 = NBRC 106471]